MMDGRVKTLHPRVHGGLLAIRAEPAHQAAMIANDIRPIDLLVVNLYPFEAALQRGADFDDMIENIDIGGPAMIRGAAKNHRDVTVIVDVADYDALIAEMAANGGGTSINFRRAMAQKAYARTAAYDAAISNWFARQDRRDAASLARLRRTPGLGAALRRKSAPARPRSTSARKPERASRARGRFKARSSPTTTSTTPTRPTNASPSSRTRPRSRSSNTPIPAASQSARRSARLMRRRSPAIPSPPSAASSRSTESSTPRRRARSSRFLRKSSSRRTQTPRRSRSLPRRRTCGCCWPATCPIRARRD